MTNDTDSQEIEQQPTEDQAVRSKEPVDDEEPFKITVQKLAVPARPRGVLAE